VNAARALAALTLVAALAGCAQVCALGWPLGCDKTTDAVEPPPPPPPGTGRRTLLLSGGGRTAGAVIAEAAKLTGGPQTRVLVLPLGVTSADAGARESETWTRAGFTRCEILDGADAKHAEAQIDGATFLWLTGGDSSRLLGKLQDGKLAARIRARYEAGAVVGGTNIGAAALAELMLGPGDDAEMLQGSVPTVGGIGLWQGVIADVHFVAKKRFNRLTSAVLDHPKFVGVGIDEGTGVVVVGTTLRVVGEGNVTVIDARRAQIAPTRPGDASAATGVSMQILSRGMTYDLAR
jgi:cyanophycinase